MSALVDQIAARHATREGGLLPCLQEIQAQVGFIPHDSLSSIAAAFSLSKAEIHGVVSFYHDFRITPAATQAVQVCCAEACQAVGSRDLESGAPTALGVAFGDTHGTENYRLERVYCLGNCACGPSVRIGDEVYGRVKLDELADLVRGALRT